MGGVLSALLGGHRRRAAQAGRTTTSRSAEPSGYGRGGAGEQRRRAMLSKKYSYIPDTYTSLDQVASALRDQGLESSNLILGVDFTKSNEWTGKRSFNGQSLHKLGDAPNPYEAAISIIGKTLASFDEDNLIPCFGFGDGEPAGAHLSLLITPTDGKDESVPFTSCALVCSDHARLQRLQLPPGQLAVPRLRGGAGLLPERRAAPQAIRADVLRADRGGRRRHRGQDRRPVPCPRHRRRRPGH
uniref:Copine C-terminal domain-containing protein n=1 Tax=Aegilops tauschii subsp. strangulata TaxID=200361 RepID=A0A453RZH5_AEGTS